MKLFSRTPADPVAVAEAAAAQTRVEIERTRQLAQLRREQEAADREARRIAEQEAEAEKRRRAEQRRTDREAARARLANRLASLRTVAPLLLINGGAAYAQAAYAAEHIAPATWNTASKVGFALAFSAALESVAVYVQWHAHDALLLKAHGTAGRLRRASWGIAAVVAGINYAHFANGIEPTAAAVAFGLLSLLSPWLWGLHTRRTQHVQLLAEDADLVDAAGVEFSPARRRAFPIRTWAAARWALDHGVRDPSRAWDGYNAERRRRQAVLPAGRVRTAITVLVGKPLRARELSGLDTVPADVRALCDSVIAQARGARQALTAGAAATVRTTIPMATTVAKPVAIPTACFGHRAGHDDGDLMAMIEATREIHPVATRLAITSGQPVASDGGQTEPAPVAKTVAAEKAEPAAKRVTTRVVTKSTTHDQIRAIAKRRPKATEAQIAEQAGVSVSTVRRALGKKS